MGHYKQYDRLQWAKGKMVKFNDWLYHQIWRSNGYPAKHPTWSICILNHKMKTVLQKQGSYTISTDQLDLSVTI